MEEEEEEEEEDTSTEGPSSSQDDSTEKPSEETPSPVGLIFIICFYVKIAAAVDVNVQHLIFSEG